MNKMSVILIPYRDRQSQLDYFIDNTVPILKKYPEISKVVVIEQGNQKLFNRGKLINIGVLEYPQAEYYITQDVDINPKDPVVSKQYCDPINSTDTIRGIYNSVCDTLGGIIKISKDNMFKINGFPNNFWGWGGEDDDIMNRINILGIPIDRTKIYYRWDYPSEVYDNLTPNDIKNKLIKEQGKKRLDLKYKKLYKKDPQYIYKNGLNNCKYTIVDYISNENMDTIIVEI